jgi:hypothetical protein
MKLTYDLNTNGCLIITADSKDKEYILECLENSNEGSRASEFEVMEHALCNSELDWVSAEEIGALTDAPILGLRDEQGEVTAAWAFMDYQVRSFLQDLLTDGEAVFIS